ncbi:ImmA/IrrE family metallo-endopeptidase [Bacillus testis]|uniref:ImmA/IrrE family metallo-endopeptidase n=1 Tax=Bacillus testis TaxID=1622072 RepID=UPI00067ED12F|nr:ImmA/IrrE family metallo-endopeptidase [Bacillus testis]
MTEQNFDFEYEYIIPPGETLLETIEAKGITQAELSQRTGRPMKTINGIIKGTIAITPETALQFEKVLGVPARFWNNLESNYREALAREKEREKLKGNENWIKGFPINELKKRGWIQEAKDDVEQLRELLKFFGVATIDAWEKVWEGIIKPDVAFRKSDKSNPGAIAAWIRKAEIEAQNIECNPYDESEFKKKIEECRKLTNEKNPDVFVPKLIELCASAGVVVVFLQELPGCKISGATKWLNSNKAMIALSLRYKSNDHLWFTFFHEAGHILLHGKRKTFIEGIETLENYIEKENEANTFSANIMIPQRRYQKFISSPQITKTSVMKFAEEINIAPGIVVGRLQKEQRIKYSYFNDLKQFYQWKK